MKTLKDYFSIKELVDADVYQRWGESAWQFIDRDLQETLLIVREGIDKPITINTWSFGGSMSQRGLRHNRSSMVVGKTKPYLSAHMMGKAVDFNVKGMGAESVRKWICDNEHLFPYKIRLEHKMNGKPITWVHLDVMYNEDNPHIYKFNV